MDVASGHCWRCEKNLPERHTTCKICNTAQYCCQKCRVDDEHRHRPECEVWGPKMCCNIGCQTVGFLKECSGCNNAWYCSSTCQQENWPQHKDTCRQHKVNIKHCAKMLQTKFQAHVRSSRPLDMPYYIGNSLPIDLLKLKGNEWDGCPISSSEFDPLSKNYSILSVGCGNLRNVIYTLASLPNRFTGKLFMTLNDIDPFVLARNVLFLYLMSIYASMENVALTLTTLWYSLHLTKSQYNLVIDSLQILIDISSDDLESVTSGVVYVDESNLRILREVWQGWLNLKCVRTGPQSINLKEQRQKMFDEDTISTEGIQVYKQQIPSKFHESVDDWIQNGVFVPRDFDRDTLTFDNPTLTGRKVGKSPWHIGEALRGDCKTPKDFTFVYCIPTDLWPFGAWDFLEARKAKASNKSLIDIFHSHISDHIEMTVKYLLSGKIEIRLVNCDCLKLREKLQSNHTKASNKFDRIFTSNVADYVGTATLLRALKPFLNTENNRSTIVTQYWNWYALLPESLVDYESYIEDGTNARCFESARRDTRQKFSTATAPRFWVQEYFNNMKCFVLYLRSDLLACDGEPLTSSNGKTNQVPSFQKVKNVDGLGMRDFRREMNKIAPFRYRRNIRPVNMLRGMSRMVEWYLL